MKLKKTLVFIAKSIFFLVVSFILVAAVSIPVGNYDSGKNPVDVEKKKLVFLNVSVIPFELPYYAFVDKDTTGALSGVSNFGLIENQNVLIEDGLITEITSDPMELDSTMIVVDATGQFLMPGLVDMHTHLFDRSDLLLYLANGVTTVRNMMGMRMHLRWRSQIENGDFVGPTIVTGSPTINSGDNPGPFHKIVKSEKKARKVVDKYKRDGYDFIKVYDGLSDEVFSTIVEESVAQNMPFAGHPPKSVQLDTLLSSGIISIEHAEEVIQTMLNYKFNEEKTRKIARAFKKNEVFLTPTLVVYSHIVKATTERDSFLQRDSITFINPLLRTIGKKQLKEWVELEDNSNVLLKYEIMERIVRIFREEGVPMLLGTDTGPNLTLAGFSLHDEIMLEMQCGLSAYEVLYNGTMAAAIALGKSISQGSITINKDADLLLLAENPLLNISALHEPIGVVKEGVWYDRNVLDSLIEEGKVHASGFRTFGRLLGHLISK